MRPPLVFENFIEFASDDRGFFQTEAYLGAVDNGSKPLSKSESNKNNFSALKFLGNARDLHVSYVKQRDVLDDGEPPLPRSGWSAKQLKLLCIIEALEHLPLVRDGAVTPYYSLELNIGSRTYKTPVCNGNSELGCVNFNQIFNTLVDDEIFDALSTSMQEGIEGPCLSATCYDCSRRLKDNIVGHVVLSMADLLEIQQEGWHTLSCSLVNSEGKNVVGRDGLKATLSMAFKIDELCKIQVNSALKSHNSARSPEKAIHSH